MKNIVFDEEDGKSGDQKSTDTSEEEEVLEGFEEEDEEVQECAECGTAVPPEKKMTREIDGEEYLFCSKECADEFEESLGSEEEE